MITKFTNAEIATAISLCFLDLSTRFQVYLSDLYKANSDPDFVQEIEISADNLLKIYKSLSSFPEGEIGKFNSQIKAKLLPIVMELAETEDEEALQIIAGIQEIDAKNESVKQGKISLGIQYLETT